MLKKLKPYFRLFIAVIMLFLLHESGAFQLSQIKMALNNSIVLTAGFVIFGIQFFIFALRFKLVTTLIQKISFPLACQLHLIGQFFNTFIPGGVGGDLVKAIELSKAIQKPKKNALAVTLVDRVVGLYGLIIFAFISLIVQMRNLSPTHTQYLIASAFLFLIATLCLLFRNTIVSLFSHFTKKLQHGFIVNVKDSILIFFDYLGDFLVFSRLNRFLFISLLVQCLSVLFLYIVVLQLNPSSTSSIPSFALFFPLACFGYVAMAIPITPGGIGFGQAAFYLIFKSFGDPIGEAALIGVSLMQLFNIFFSLPGGYYFTRSTYRSQTPAIDDV